MTVSQDCSLLEEYSGSLSRAGRSGSRATVRGWKGLKCGGRRTLPSSQELSPPDELDAYFKEKQSQNTYI